MNTVEVDLHMERLLDNTTGFSNADMLEYQIEAFRKAMERYKRHKGCRVVFIHGGGTGRLKSRIETTIKRQYRQYEFVDASTINPFKYRMGTAIAVTIK